MRTCEMRVISHARWIVRTPFAVRRTQQQLWWSSRVQLCVGLSANGPARYRVRIKWKLVRAITEVRP
ncbi:hypothetical protein BDFB_011463 [Asbolus verrucosus]|uniref:Uncharacterized protein n=1 Tax=Asbolus verrucosus TaxID=1661398 RepID=A0A482W4A7_ASBVE|nr:hypothetical protein BDFB_011463 [Asbolus verrucosus]